MFLRKRQQHNNDNDSNSYNYNDNDNKNKNDNNKDNNKTLIIIRKFKTTYVHNLKIICTADVFHTKKFASCLGHWRDDDPIVARG